MTTTLDSFHLSLKLPFIQVCTTGRQLVRVVIVAEQTVRWRGRTGCTEVKEEEESRRSLVHACVYSNAGLECFT